VKGKNASPLEAFRREHGITRAELARQTGIGYVTLSNIENGYVLSITETVQEKLATAGAPEDLPELYQLWRSGIEKASSSAETEDE